MAGIKQRAKLLTDPEQPRTWFVHVRGHTGQWGRLEYSERTLAESEYHRLKNSGTFGGAWISEIQLEEHLSTKTS